MHNLGEYIYDPDRLIFYKSNLGSEVVEKICNHIERNNDYEELKEKLENYDANAVKLRPGALSRAGICLTDNCNFRCDYCSETSSEMNKGSLELEDVLTFINDVMKRWTINKFITEKEEPLSIYFTGGGEPTYNWNLFEKVIPTVKNKCEENSIPLSLSLTTNGMLNDAQREFIAEHFNTIMISYDGLPEIQNKNRRSKSHSQTAEAVEKTIAFFSSNKPSLTIRTTIWQDDFCHMKDMADYIFDKFGDSFEWSVLPVIPTGRALKKIHKEQKKLRESNFLIFYLEAMEYIKFKHGSLSISTPIFPNSIAPIYCGGISIFCSCPWLLPNKTIVTCIESCDQKTIIGRIKENKVEYFEKCSDPFLRVYQQKFNECRDCIAYRFCKGGCPARDLMNKNLKTEMDDWECSMIQKYWTYIFTNILSGKSCFGWHVIPVEIEEIKEYSVLKLDRNN